MGLAALIVVDTSALVAVLLMEEGHAPIRAVLETEVCTIPSPVVVEFYTVLSSARFNQAAAADQFLGRLLQTTRIKTVPFGMDDAREANRAAATYGKGRENRAKLNVVDLMVYGTAKRLGAPILCTGRDFAQTDAAIHPASRIA